MTGRAPCWHDARRLLCVRLDSLGDVLMCTPAVRVLRAARPGRTITLLSSPSGAAAAPFLPDVDAAIAAGVPWMKGAGAGRAADDARNDVHALAARLAAERFDAAVIFTSYTQSALPAALLCCLAGIPLRLAHCREHPYGLLSDWVPDPEPACGVRHEVQRQLALAHRVAGAATVPRTAAPELSFVPRPRDIALARRHLLDAGVDPDRPWLLLHPGAGAASRRYPAAQWACVVRLLHDSLGIPVVLTGDAGESALVGGIAAAAGVPAHALAGRFRLGELGAALALAAVAVTNNSGPAHIAAAVGTPVVDLYALTNPQHTPWNVPNRVLFQDVPCRFCFKSVCPAGHHACLAGIAPDRVVGAVRELLARGRSSGPARPLAAGVTAG
jgi:lipopolysaccharide heptosyltransferase II